MNRSAALEALALVEALLDHRGDDVQVLLPYDMQELRDQLGELAAIYAMTLAANHPNPHAAIADIRRQIIEGAP